MTNQPEPTHDLQANSNNFEHGPVKAANRGAAFLRPRASPTKPKPSPRFSPYQLTLADGQADITGITRSGSGPSLLVSTDSDSASPNSQQTYSAFAAHGLAGLDTLAHNGGYAAQPALTAGLPASLIYSAAMQVQCSQGMAAYTGYINDGVKQDGAADASYMVQQYAAAYHLAGYSTVPMMSNSSGGSATASPAAVAVDDGGSCGPSRLAIASHPGDRSGYPCTGSVGCGAGPLQPPQQQQLMQFDGQQQQQHYVDGVDDVQHADLPSLIDVGSLDQMPSLPEPAEQGILEGGDGDGTSLRGIFSSDDGEHHQPHHQHQQQQQGLQQIGSSSSSQQQQQHDAKMHLSGIDIAAATGGLGSMSCSVPAGQQIKQQQPATDTGFPSPSSFASGGSPVCYFQQQTGSAAALHASTAHMVQPQSTAETTYPAGSTCAADGSSAAGTGTANVCNYHQQQQQQYVCVPTTAEAQMQQQHLSVDKYTPFGHPHHQQQHIHHIFDNASFTNAGHQQQQLLLGYPSFQPPAVVVTAAMDGFDSGKSSHLNALNSPCTMAQSAAAAVVRLAAIGAADSSSPTSIAAKPDQLNTAADHKQYAAVLQLLPRTPSLDINDELGPLADLLADDSGDAEDRSCNQTLQEECDLLAAAVHAAGAYHEPHMSPGDLQQQYTGLDVLPGLNRQNSELEMMATAACW